ncbi:MAG: NADH-quinone oxidoreductase subunit L [Geobacteraceae bacterium]|nr:NADH-quinone oxidoreductase subunit L [Geobacteraceae bacterium]
MKLYLELIILLPLFGALINALCGRHLPRRLSEWLACAAIGGSFAAALAAFSSYSSPVRIEIASWLADFDFSAPLALYLDPLSLSLTLMITFVCGLIHLYSVAYMAEDPCYVRYFALLNLFVAAMLLLVLAENLPLLYMGWEGVGFCSYALIGFWYKEVKNADAGRKAFIVTRVGDVAFGIAIVWLFMLCSTESIVDLNSMGGSIPPWKLTAIGLLLLFGAAGKSAQAPLMVWLPDAMAGPTPVSAQIHAATMVTAGVYLLMRLFPLICLSPTVLAAIAITGTLTALYGASCALVQRDLKRVLAYSTISQIGFMMLGVGAGGITAATFHLLIHAFFKALLFLAAGCVITAMHHEQDIYRMGGLRKTAPLTFYGFLAGALCLAGFPLTGGFFSKDGILTAVWEQGGTLYSALYTIGLLTAYITALYTFRTLLLVFGGDCRSEHKTAPVPPLMNFILLPLALVALAGGLLNLPTVFGSGLLSGFLAPLIVGPVIDPSHSTELALLLASSAAAFTGIGLAWLRYGGGRRQLRLNEAEQPLGGLSAFLFHGWYLDDLYALLFIHPFIRLSQFFWKRVDEQVIDGSMDRFAGLLGRWGMLLGSLTCGRVSLYLLSFAAGAALLVGWLAWLMFSAGGG